MTNQQDPGFEPQITAFYCIYCGYMAADTAGALRIQYPANVKLVRLPCTGKTDSRYILKAFEDGADGVYVVGCPEDECHNVKGSIRAAKRVVAVRAALEELGVEGERVQMYHLPRGLHPEFVEKGKEMDGRIRDLGPSPFKN